MLAEIKGNISHYYSIWGTRNYFHVALSRNDCFQNVYAFNWSQASQTIHQQTLGREPGFTEEIIPVQLYQFGCRCSGHVYNDVIRYCRFRPTQLYSTRLQAYNSKNVSSNTIHPWMYISEYQIWILNFLCLIKRQNVHVHDHAFVFIGNGINCQYMAKYGNKITAKDCSLLNSPGIYTTHSWWVQICSLLSVLITVLLHSNKTWFKIFQI